MNLSGKIIKEQFKQKSKYVYLVLIVQIIVSVFAISLALFNKNGSQYSSLFYESNHFTEVAFETAFIISIFADVAYCAISCWRNEKVNLSETWNLIPVSSGKLWLNNIFSSLLTCAYIFIVQNVLLALVALSTKNDITAPLREYGLWGNELIISSIIERLIFLILMVTFIYAFVSFVNFCSKVIVDRLPFKETLWIKLFVMAVLSIIAVYFGSIILARTAGYIETHFTQINTKYTFISDPMWFDNLELLIADIIVGIIDIILINKYVESK
ncbi:hypothetical protein [Lactobacillus intestinalis]|uniref:hypothetical protein n=1 Tax=Lactobacillus intestinalis TaxID=151781 RepID=UPI0025A93B44|nr:hypothetical protein [Lactobacillus intestinalis]